MIELFVSFRLLDWGGVAVVRLAPCFGRTQPLTLTQTLTLPQPLTLTPTKCVFVFNGCVRRLKKMFLREYFYVVLRRANRHA